MLAQFVHETGWFYRQSSPEGVDPSFCNPCGLKTADLLPEQGCTSNVHKRFSDWETGFTAQRDHLRLYAGDYGVPLSSTPDPRHFAYLTASARTVEALGGKWALDPEYGQKIVSKFMVPLLSAPAGPAATHTICAQ